MAERWKDIKGYEGLYQVSDAGRVKMISLKGKPTNTILKLQINHRGYQWTLLSKPGHKRKGFRIGRLVLTAFVGEPMPGEECNHLNADKLDDHLENLEWASPKENMRHAKEHGLILRGEEVALSVLKESDIPEIFRMKKKGKSHKEIGEIFDVHHKTIAVVLSRKTWSHIEVDLDNPH